MSISRVYRTLIHWLGSAVKERPRIITNPIILRELLVHLRKKQSFLSLFLFLAGGAITFVSWWSEYQSPAILIYYNYDTMARDLLFGLTMVEGIILLIISPLLSATAVNLEKERETWDLLQTTPISLFSVILGKYLSSLFFVWIVALSILPIFSLTLPVGGVSPTEILVIFGVFTEGAAIASLIGLYSSIRWTRAIQSITFTYLFCFLFFFGVPIFPCFFTNQFSITTLLSPVMPGLIVLLPGGSVSQALGLSDKQALWLHFIFFAFTILALLALCVWQLAPARIERAKAFWRRKAIEVGDRLNNVVLLAFLIVGVWISIALIQCWVNYIDFGAIFREFVTIFLGIIGALGVLLFPTICIVKYQTAWDRQPWQEAASTPKLLRRFLFRTVKEPFMLYGKWMALISPFFLVIFIMQPKAIPASLWTILFLGEMFFFISAIALACSLMTRSIFLSLVYTYGFMVGAFFFMPFVVSICNPFLGAITSPLSVAYMPFLENNRYFSFQKIDRFYPHFLLVILYIEVCLIFSERRILSIAGKFKRESISQWIRRTLKNQTPTIDADPLTSEIHFFPDGKNPIYVRERRDFLLYRRSSFMKGMIGLFLASSTLFLFFPLVSNNFYMHFIENSELTSPLMTLMCFIPFFILPYASNSFRKEHDQSTWDLITTTTASPMRMVLGKLRAILWLFHRRFLIFLLPIFGLGFFLQAIGKVNNPKILSFLLYGIAIIYLYAFFFASIALFVSARVSKTTTAYVVPLIAAYLFLALPIFAEIFRIHSNEVLMVLSPLDLLDKIRYKPEYWNRAFGMQLSLYVYLSLLFFALAYTSIRNSIVKS